MNELSPAAEELKDQQGWNENTMLTLALQFITQKTLDAHFVEFLQERADEENEASDTAYNADDFARDYPNGEPTNP